MSTSVTTTLNDVNMDAVAGLAGKIQQQPEVADTKWNARVHWKGGFRSEATIRDFDPTASDEPGALGGTDTGPNPVEQVLAALGNCLAVGYAANATAAGIELKDLSIELEGDLDLHTFLGLSPQGNAGYNNISVRVSIESCFSHSSGISAASSISVSSPTAARSAIWRSRSKLTLAPQLMVTSV